MLADTLDGGAGDDTLIAGKGDDTYIVDSTTDKIVEAAKEGTDTIKTALVSYTLGANAKNVEILSFTGVGAFTGTGDGAANTIIGGTQADTLKGLGGDDTLDGGAGGDTLEGGAGNDTYIVDSTSDIVTELASGGTDTIKTALTVFDLSDPSKPGRLQGWRTSTYTGVLTATLTGNALANVIKGGTNGNTIHGKAGDDQLFGGTDPELPLRRRRQRQALWHGRRRPDFRRDRRRSARRRRRRHDDGRRQQQRHLRCARLVRDDHGRRERDLGHRQGRVLGGRTRPSG